jgi:putative glutamine amidotransferase
MRPVIGMTLELNDHLIKEVEHGLRDPLTREGALVIAIPRDTPAHEIDSVIGMIDGLVLSGGADVHPDYYGEAKHELTHAVPEAHDAFEIGVTRRALDMGMPVLGICRGSQVVAVADGGALTQDVEALHEGGHRHTGPWYEIALDPPGDHWHEITVAPGSMVEGWLAGGRLWTNTFHHQCVKRAGNRMRATAWAPDGIIEATERCDGRGWAVGLQWHNELMHRHDPRFEAPHLELGRAARAFAERRSQLRIA